MRLPDKRREPPFVFPSYPESTMAAKSQKSKKTKPPTAPPRPAQLWEYATDTLPVFGTAGNIYPVGGVDAARLQAMLQSRGSEKWELVASVYVTPTPVRTGGSPQPNMGFIFKRPLP